MNEYLHEYLYYEKRCYECKVGRSTAVISVNRCLRRKTDHEDKNEKRKDLEYFREKTLGLVNYIGKQFYTLKHRIHILFACT